MQITFEQIDYKIDLMLNVKANYFVRNMHEIPFYFKL